MSVEHLSDRLERIYAAVGANVSQDFESSPSQIVEGTDGEFSVIQDFAGGRSPAELNNLAYSAIHNIANFCAVLNKWFVEQGHGSKQANRIAAKHPAIQVIRDLSDFDKHPHPRNDGGYSKRAPKMQNLRGELWLGAGAGIRFTQGGVLPFRAKEGTAAKMVVTADIVASDGTAIGDLYTLEEEAVTAWETELRVLGLLGSGAPARPKNDITATPQTKLSSFKYTSQTREQMRAQEASLQTRSAARADSLPSRSTVRFDGATFLRHRVSKSSNGTEVHVVDLRTTKGDEVALIQSGWDDDSEKAYSTCSGVTVTGRVYTFPDGSSDLWLESATFQYQR